MVLTRATLGTEYTWGYWGCHIRDQQPPKPPE